LLIVSIIIREVDEYFSKDKLQLIIIVLLFALALVTSGIVKSQNIIVAFIGTYSRNLGVITYLSLLTLFIIFATNSKINNFYLVVKFLSFTGIILLPYGIIQSIGLDFIDWEGDRSPIILTLGNENFASSFLALTLFASIFQSLITKRGGFKIFYTLIISLKTYLILTNPSIQGKILVIIGVILVSLFYFFLKHNGKLLRIFLISIITFLSTSTVFLVSLIARTGKSNFLSIDLFSLQDRFQHWQAAINMFTNNKIFGVGISSYIDYYKRYRTPQSIELRGEFQSTVDNAHNIYLNFAATGGLVLLLTYIIFSLFIIYRIIVMFRNKNHLLLKIFLASLWFIYQLQLLISIENIGIAVWGWIIAGSIVGISQLDMNSELIISRDVIKKTQKLKNLTAKLIQLILLIYFVLCTVLVFYVIDNVQNEFNIKKFLSETIITSDSNSTKNQFVKLANLAIESNNPQTKIRLAQTMANFNSLELALRVAIQTSETFPLSVSAWDTIATIYEKNGQKEKAIYARQRTVFLDPLNSEFKALLKEDLAYVQENQTSLKN
jgi:O-antigen ligase